MAGLDVKKATKELEEKTMDDIERMTALTWGARAVASYSLSTTEDSVTDRFSRFYQGENFRQEAFEHASMVEDEGDLLHEIREDVESERKLALKQLQQVAATATT